MFGTATILALTISQAAFSNGSTTHGSIIQLNGFFDGAGGGTRTHTEVDLKRILSSTERCPV
jgi:hypothetical protein